MLHECRQCQRHQESGEQGLSHEDHSQNSALTFLSLVLPITENEQPLMCNFTSDICRMFLAQQSGIVSIHILRH